MAPAWLIPTLKAVAPHLADIVASSLPAFAPRGASPEIVELQLAVKRNAANVKELAEQLQRTVEAVDAAARVAERRLRLALWLSAGAVLLAVVALAAAILAIAR